LPLIKPILIYLAVTNFNAAWNDFEGPMSFISNNQEFWTLSLSLYRRSTSVSNPMFANQQMAIGVIMMIPGVLFFAFFQKELMEGVAMTGLKG
jgi:multiple sugar transport system permease protein